MNTGIFSVTMLAVSWLVWEGVQLNKKQQLNFVLATRSVEQSAATQAKLDANDELYMNYIKSTVKSMWDKLQKDNENPEDIKRRGILVPKSPDIPLRPKDLPPPSEKEFERPRTFHAPIPTPTPRIIIKDHYHNIKAKEKPNKSLWDILFKAHRP